ncbi:MAG: hypothetical protein E7169_03335 [Firmicutes bacterium]|nr:hypothetical protein [Bacillota bacterium]
MEFKEFSNPLENDYDINSSHSQTSKQDQELVQSVYNKQMMTILNEIGLLEDDDLKKANISFEEYLNPTKETILKLKTYRDSLVKPIKNGEEIGRNR